MQYASLLGYKIFNIGSTNKPCRSDYAVEQFVSYVWLGSYQLLPELNQSLAFPPMLA